MKNNVIVVACFFAGIMIGVFFGDAFIEHIKFLPTLLLYALIFQVGLNISASGELGGLIRNLSVTTVTLPIFTIAGSWVFAALSSLLLTSWSFWECMALGSGFSYYSLSSILITQLKEPTLGVDMATQLGAIALLANIFRELIALVAAPLLGRVFGKFAPVSAAGCASMDICMPAITRFAGKSIVPIALIHGVVIDMSVPFMVTLFCKL